MKVGLSIEGMHCASCTSTIEAALRDVEGVNAVTVNYANQKAYVWYDESVTSVDDLAAAVADAGYDVSEDSFHDSEERSQRNNFLLALVLSIPVVAWTYLDSSFLKPSYAEYYMFVLTAVIVGYAGRQFFIRAWGGMKRVTANMDTLVALGVSSAFIYSTVSVFALEGQPVFFETAAMLTTFILFGRYLEAITKGRASKAIQSLVELQPSIAVVERDGEEVEVSTSEVKKGDIVVAKPAQKLPVDGIVVEGSSTVDESLVTGESMPVSKKEGDEVIGGSLNRRGVFRYKATKVGGDTVLQQILALVEEAQSETPPIQDLADTVAKYFVPIIIVVALATFSTWLFLGKGVVFALTLGISVLVIACPCALGLATPTAVMVGTGEAAKGGILIRSGVALEHVGRLDTVVFDKTGTLTKGEPVVTDIAVTDRFDPKVTLKYAAVAEHHSTHPLAKAVRDKAASLDIKVVEPKSFEEREGEGVWAETTGKEILVGSKDYVSHYYNITKLEAKISDFEHEGKTCLVVAVDGEPAGVIAVADELRSDAKDAVEYLQGFELDVKMLTGDNERVARAVASELGVNDFIAEVKPSEKDEVIQKLQDKGKTVAMVGDGVNDAPALTRADVGIAIGAGTDVAIESGDIVLMHSKVLDVARAVNISRRTLSKIKENLFWAFAYNVAMVPLAAGVFYLTTGWLLQPEIAGLAMALSSVTVVVNSLLLRKNLPRKDVKIKL
jgi:Cu+-exporting ATPase